MALYELRSGKHGKNQNPHVDVVGSNTHQPHSILGSLFSIKWAVDGGMEGIADA